MKKSTISVILIVIFCQGCGVYVDDDKSYKPTESREKEISSKIYFEASLFEEYDRNNRDNNIYMFSIKIKDCGVKKSNYEKYVIIKSAYFINENNQKISLLPDNRLPLRLDIKATGYKCCSRCEDDDQYHLEIDLFRAEYTFDNATIHFKKKRKISVFFDTVLMPVNHETSISQTFKGVRRKSIVAWVAYENLFSIPIPTF